MKKHLFLLSFVFFLSQSGQILFSQENVGIGSTSPLSRLEVQGDPDSDAPINVYSKVNFLGLVDVRAFEGLSIPNAGWGIGGRFTGGFRGVDGIADGTNFTGTATGVYGSATGTVGTRVGTYGTASGGAVNYGVYGEVSGGADYYGVFGKNTNLGGYAGFFNGRGHFSEELRADKNLLVDDNTGIGTLTPTTKLQIIGGGDVSLAGLGYIQNGSTSGQNLILDDNELMSRNNGAAADLFLQHDTGDLILCGLENGSVGIGVMNGGSIPAGYLLAVDGKIITEELRIQNSAGWPDYVFSEEYHLLSLDELNQSIREHRHLPNIPSATEVANEGILVGDMQKRMMEKIEELTLYLLQQHEINKLQQSEIENLKATINELRKP